MDFADDCGLLLDLRTNGRQKGGTINQGTAVKYTLCHGCSVQGILNTHFIIFLGNCSQSKLFIAVCMFSITNFKKGNILHLLRKKCQNVFVHCY